MSLDMFAGVSDNLINYTCNVRPCLLPWFEHAVDHRVDGIVRDERGHVSSFLTATYAGARYLHPSQATADAHHRHLPSTDVPLGILRTCNDARV